MIKAVENRYSYFNKITTGIGTIDVASLSPKELEALVEALYEQGEITYKESLLFKTTCTKDLPADMSLSLGKLIFECYSKMKDDPNSKKDLLSELTKILHIQVKANVDIAESGLKVLQIIQKKYFFGILFKSYL